MRNAILSVAIAVSVIGFGGGLAVLIGAVNLRRQANEHDWRQKASALTLAGWMLAVGCVSTFIAAALRH